MDFLIGFLSAFVSQWFKKMCNMDLRKARFAIIRGHEFPNAIA
jgi:hypothetical protein